MPPSVILLGAVLLGGALASAFVPTLVTRPLRDPLVNNDDQRHARRARGCRLVPLAVSKKDKAIKEEEKRRVEALAASRLKVLHISPSRCSPAVAPQ